MTIQEFDCLSIKTISELTGKPLSNWSRWVRGRSMTYETLLDCSNKLFMSPETLHEAIGKRRLANQEKAKEQATA
jgi:hypothetical protein